MVGYQGVSDIHWMFAMALLVLSMVLFITAEAKLPEPLEEPELVEFPWSARREYQEALPDASVFKEIELYPYSQMTNVFRRVRDLVHFDSLWFPQALVADHFDNQDAPSDKSEDELSDKVRGMPESPPGSAILQDSTDSTGEDGMGKDSAEESSINSEASCTEGKHEVRTSDN